MINLTKNQSNAATNQIDFQEFNKEEKTSKHLPLKLEVASKCSQPISERKVSLTKPKEREIISLEEKTALNQFIVQGGDLKKLKKNEQDVLLENYGLFDPEIDYDFDLLVKTNTFLGLLKLEKIDITQIKKYGIEIFTDNAFKTLLKIDIHQYNIEGLIDQLPEDFKKNKKTWEILCQSGCDIMLVPEKYRSQRLWEIACSQNSQTLQKAQHKTLRLYKIAGEQFPWLINNAPKEWKNRLWEFAYSKNQFAAAMYDKRKDEMTEKECLMISYHANWQKPKLQPHLKTSAFYSKICALKGDNLSYVPKDEINYELCKIACTSDPSAAEFVPSWCKTDDLYKIIFQRIYYCLDLIPEDQRNYELCKLACRQHGSAISHVPMPYREELYKTACQSSFRALEHIPEENRSLELCEIALKQSHKAWPSIPQFFRTQELLLKTYPLKENRCLHKTIVSILNSFPHSKEQLIPKLLEKHFVNTHELVLILSDDRVSVYEKIVLLEAYSSIKHSPDKRPSTTLLRPVESRVSPIQSVIINPFLDEHVEMAYTSHFSPKKLYLSTELKELMKNKLEISEENGLAQQLLSEKADIVSGRTIKLPSAQTPNFSVYYKIQRVGETLNDLAREAFMNQFCHQHPVMKQLLKSRLPVCQGIKKIIVDDDLKSRLQQLSDTPEIIEHDKKEYIHVYCYLAEDQYCQYAHRLQYKEDRSPDFLTSERALFKASHDLAVFFDAGFVLTSILPAFHDLLSSRKWLALHSALGYESGLFRNPYPGTFGAWDTVATEHCDLGLCGIRDVGDFEFYGDIKIPLQSNDTVPFTHNRVTTQRLLFTNTLIEGLLAVILVRSRLRQQVPEYHYRNPDAISDTKKFIQGVLCHFIQGLTDLKEVKQHQLEKNVIGQLRRISFMAGANFTGAGLLDSQTA